MAFFLRKISSKGYPARPSWTILVSVWHVCVFVRFLAERSKKMATGKSCSRWFAAMAALLMVVSLSGCFDKEGDQRKAFIDFLQNTAMRSGERLPTLTADQKNSLGRLSLTTR